MLGSAGCAVHDAVVACRKARVLARGGGGRAHRKRFPAGGSRMRTRRSRSGAAYWMREAPTAGPPADHPNCCLVYGLNEKPIV